MFLCGTPTPNPQTGVGAWSSIIMLVAMMAMLYFFTIKPQKKREKEIAEMRNAIKPGDEIITIGGICGKIISVKEDFITLEIIPSKVKVKMTKWSISTVVNSKNTSQKSLEENDTKEDEVETEN